MGMELDNLQAGGVQAAVDVTVCGGVKVGMGGGGWDGGGIGSCVLWKMASNSSATIGGFSF